MTRRTLAILILIPFSILSLYAVMKVVYIGIFDYHRHSPAGWQVFTDLVIACILLLALIVPEAQRRGINPWPFVLLTVVLGSFGPLAYFVYAGSDKAIKS